MKVREVMDKCKELIEVDNTMSELLDCFNRVEHELALDYLPLYDTHICNSNLVSYSDFKYCPVRIVNCNCKFKIYPDHIESKEIIKEIIYAYTPNSKDIFDDCSYNNEVFNCLVYGTIAEFLTLQGFYEEAALWDKKYKKEIKFLMI